MSHALTEDRAKSPDLFQPAVDASATGLEAAGAPEAKDSANQRCIHHLVEAQAERTPDAVAVVFAGRRLTYRELDQRAGQLACHLQRLGAGPEHLVGLFVDRTPAMIVGLLGILKAGAAYLPLDPAYAGERLAFVLADAQVRIVLTTENVAHKLPAAVEKTLCLDEDWLHIAAEPAQRPPGPSSPAMPHNLAYVIYTSGSTGQPEGVAIEHHSLVNYISAVGKDWGIGANDRVLQFASVGFDTAAEEIFCALAHGATLVLRSQTMVDSPSHFIQACRDLQLTVIDLPTAYWHVLVQQLEAGNLSLPASVRLVIIGGESALPGPVQAWRRRVNPLVRLVNTYGPTEATIVATMCDLAGPLAPADDGEIPPIGRPVANVEVHLLDEAMQPVGVGLPGEIYIGGAGVARGYLNRPDLVAQKFVPNPLSPKPGHRLYKTGDVGRFLPDGSIEFVGRLDDQVKVRGFRVELGEVEAALNAHPAVRQGVVAALDDGAGGKQLAAYYVAAAGSEPDVASLREHLAARLPAYMLPATWSQLDALPLTINGKVDRKRLPPPSLAAMERSTPFAPPRTALELQLAEIWGQVLGRQPAGIHDDFFEAGGHSLAAARLFVQIENRLGRLLPLATLLQAPTVAKLAAVMQDGEWTPPWASLVPIQPLGSKPPFFCVHGFGGDVVGYHDLAYLLGPDQPFYGLQARGLNDLDTPHSDIVEMAAEYIRFMRSMQPHGPYYLGGYCYGGVVAFEMARQLEQAGERTALLAIFEGYAIGRRATLRKHWRPKVMLSFLRNLPYWLRDNLHPDGPYAHLLPWEQVQRLQQLGREPARLDCPLRCPSASGDFADRRRQLEAAHDLAMTHYRPGPYAGRLTLFRVQAMSLFRAHDPTMGWGEWAQQGVDVRMTPGTHYNILERPHVAGLAAQLRQCLQAAQANE